MLYNIISFNAARIGGIKFLPVAIDRKAVFERGRSFFANRQTLLRCAGLISLFWSWLDFGRRRKVAIPGKPLVCPFGALERKEKAAPHEAACFPMAISSECADVSFFEVRFGHDPLFDVDAYPDGIDAERHDSQQPP